MSKNWHNYGREGTLNRLLRIVFVLLLLIIALVQFFAAKGIFAAKERQQVCPVNAIYMKNGKAMIDSLKCIGCRRCVDGFVAIPNQNIVDSNTPQATIKEDGFINSDDSIPKASANDVQPMQKIKENLNVKDEESIQDSLLSILPATKQFYVVDASTCISCGLCLKVCPVDAISYKDGKAFIDPEKCINCGICAGTEPTIFRGCPVDAIHPSGI